MQTYRQNQTKAFGILAKGIVVICGCMYLAMQMAYTFDADALRRNFASAATKSAIGANSSQLEIVHNLRRDHSHYHRIIDYLKSTGLSVSSLEKNQLDPKVLQKMAFGEEALIAIWSKKLEDNAGDPQIRRLFIGNDVLVARQRLRRLDGMFRLRVQQFLAVKPVIGFTTMHGEHAWTGQKDTNDIRQYKYIKGSLRGAYRELRSLSGFVTGESLAGIEAVFSLDAHKGWFAREESGFFVLTPRSIPKTLSWRTGSESMSWGTADSKQQMMKIF